MSSRPVTGLTNVGAAGPFEEEAMGTVHSSDGTTIAFDRTGEGPPLILVDGAIAHRAINPTSGELASLLASRFTVYSHDRRGRGGSGDTKPYAIGREIEDLDAIIAEAGSPAFVLGGSSGAMLVLDAAAQGLAIRRLAVYEPPIIVDDSRPPLPDDYVRRLEESAAAGRPGDAVEIFFTDAMRLPPRPSLRCAVGRSGRSWRRWRTPLPTTGPSSATP
jgi:pimeloyl-ACP methyl ester carboxylesterase